MSSSKDSTSRINLTKEEIVHFARQVVQTMQCEWEGCTVVLNSWDMLAKHLFRHCARVVQQDGMYQCSYSRCSGRSHGTMGAVKAHVELSHLSRVALPCPARGCNEVFVRLSQLKSHFEQMHRDLLANKHVSLADLAPLSILSPPHHLRSPPPLPHEQMLTESVLSSISIPRMHPGHSQASVSQGLSRKWSRLVVQDDDSKDNPIVFNDLSPPQCYDLDDPPVVDIEVQRKLPLSKQPLLSRPQPKIHPRIGSESPEQAILYPRFVHMVDNLVATGALSWHKEDKN